MATVRDRGAVMTVSKSRSAAASLRDLPITLADFITAIQDVVGPEADGLVVATVWHLLRSGRLKGRGTDICRGPAFNLRRK
jgi:hypothetical protein